VTTVKIPPRCPRANAYAERFVLTDQMLVFGERHLRHVLAAYLRNSAIVVDGAAVPVLVTHGANGTHLAYPVGVSRTHDETPCGGPWSVPSPA
jgi:hypothetical protein